MLLRRLAAAMAALVVTLGLAPGLLSAQEGAGWTFMVYLAGDNDLETSALLDFGELEWVGSTQGVNVVAQFDRAEGEDDSQGDWTDAHRYFVQQDRDPDSINSQLVESLGEVNMGAEETLADFLIWGATNYPAQHYALVIWDHGSGWPGTAYDDSADGDGLSIPEIARALERMGVQTGVEKLDLIAFDACLMGQLEVFAAVAPHAQIGVASPELVPGDGFDYVGVLNALVADPATDATALSRVMVDTYMHYFQNVDTSNPAFGLTAVDLTRVEAVTAALGELGAAVGQNPEAVLSHIGDARNSALAYAKAYLDAEELELFASVDLADLMTRLAGTTNVSSVADAAQAVADAVAQMVVYEGHSDALEGARGVSIYFPRTLAGFEERSEGYEGEGVGNARWVNFLGLYYGTVSNVVVEAPQLFITNLFRETVSIHTPTQVSLDVTGRDIAGMDFVLNYELEDGRYVTLDRDALIVSWDDGLNSVYFSWEGDTPIVSDGRTQTYALLVVKGDNLDVAVGRGRYAPAGSEKWVEASLVFDIDTQQVTAVYGLSGPPDIPPFEIKPNPGDQFQLYWSFINDDGSITTQPGETLIFGDEPFFYDYAPAPDGAYRMGFVVENIAGSSSYRWVDLRVSNAGLDTALRGYTDWDFGFNFLYPETWYAPSWDSESEVLYASAEDADISFTIYPLPDAKTLKDAAAALHSQWEVDVNAVSKREATVGDQPALVVRYEYEAQKGPRGGVYTVFYHPALDMAFGFDLDAAPEDAEAAVAAMDGILDSLTLFDPATIAGGGPWTTDVNQALGYALPVRSSWLPRALNEAGWLIYSPEEGGGQTFVALRVDPSRGQSNQALAEEWLAAMTRLADHLNVQVVGEREYYIGDENWYAIDFTYTWAATNTPTSGAFFVASHGGVSYVYWIEAPSVEYEIAYADTFSVMIDGFEFLAGAQPTFALPTAGGLLRQVYTAAGDSYRPEQVTPTATFGPDDDLNVVFVTDQDAQVTVTFVTPEGERNEIDPVEAEVGISALSGLDWETRGEPWPLGQWSAEVYVDGQLAQTLTFTVEGEPTSAAIGPLSDVYTAAGDGVRPEELTPTSVFTTDDDINIVVTVARAAEVRAVFNLPGDLSGEDGPASLAAGESRVFGLDWETYGQPWPTGDGAVEVYVDGELIETLAFTTGGAAGGALSNVYTASGDGLEPEELTATTVFTTDDDINVVIYAAESVQVTATFVLPDGERSEFDPVDLAAGNWQVFGLDWEANAQPWPTGSGSVEVDVNGNLFQSLPFTVEGASLRAGPISAYTSAGDELTPEAQTATTTFTVDDDLNVVIEATGAARVSMVIVLPSGERVDFDPVDMVAGDWQIYGLDREGYGEPWPTGQYSAEIYVDGELYLTLPFTVGR